MLDTETLTEEQLGEIEARKPFQYGTMVSLTVAQRDALCRSLRAAWAEIRGIRRGFPEWAAEWDDLKRTLRESEDENIALRQQLETQAESIFEFQENEKSLKAQLRDLVAAWRRQCVEAEPEINRTWDDDGALRVQTIRKLADELSLTLDQVQEKPK